MVIQTTNQKKTYRPKDVAQILGIGINLAYRQLEAGTIPGIRIGKNWVIPKVRFDTWLDGQNTNRGGDGIAKS
jgi:excisionase family DNA binding protein